MKIYFNGWFGGFIEKTNPGLNVDFFLNLFEKVFKKKCEIGNLENSEILCEFCMLLNTSGTKLKTKTWKHTFLMSGESDLRSCEKFKNEYDCILWMERNNKNIINIPLHIAYIYTNNFLQKLETKRTREKIPERDYCCYFYPNGKTK